MQRPRVYRAVGANRVTCQIPYEGGSNRRWIHEALGSQIRPEYNRQTREWEIARAHLLTLVEALAERFGEVDVLLEYSTTQKCDRRCREAQGDDCECSCLGEHHAGGMYMNGWIEVGDTTLIQPGRQLRRMRVVRH